MFTKFHNVSFIASTVTGLELEQNVIHILTTGQGYEVRFTTKKEAENGLQELTDLLNAELTGTSKTTQEDPKAFNADDLKDTIAAGWDRILNVSGRAKTTTDKVQEALMAQVFGSVGKTVSDLFDRKDDLVKRATDMLSSLESLLDTEEVAEEPKPMATRNEPKAKPTPTAQTATPAKNTEEAVHRATSILDTDGIFSGAKGMSESNADVKAGRDIKKITTEEFKKIFGTPAEPVIGDMSERQVREFISEFVDSSLANERVQQLFQNIKENFGADEAEGAIDGYKKLILTICLQNTEITLSEIISRYFN